MIPKLDHITKRLPIVGVFAFALASVWSLYQMFNDRALHPTPLYWIPSALVEIVTAWLVYQTVESVRKITRSNISKQDRRFYWVLFALCLVLASPTLWVSFIANRFEFQGDIGLALLFPVACVACAVASAIPTSKTRQIDERVQIARDEAKALRKQRNEARDENKVLRGQVQSVDRLHEEISEAHRLADVARADAREMLNKARGYRAEIAELERGRAFAEPSNEIYQAICANLNGNRPTNAQGVNRLLVENGYWPVAGSTARSWVE
jgi:hypothetical protein